MIQKAAGAKEKDKEHDLHPVSNAYFKHTILIHNQKIKFKKNYISSGKMAQRVRAHHASLTT